MEELGRLKIDQFKNASKVPVVVVLDNVRSLNNIGSIFRTCDAFRIERLILCGISTPPPHREIHKSALGAELAVDWEYYEHTNEAIQTLQKQGYMLIGIEQTHDSLSLQNIPEAVKQRSKKALIFGHEIRGISQEVINQCNYTIEIPQFGTKHSFNVAVSAGIVLWQLLKDQGLKTK